MNEKYKKIFEPLTIKRMTVKNRVVMPPMGTNFRIWMVPSVFLI